MHICHLDMNLFKMKYLLFVDSTMGPLNLEILDLHH